MIRVSVTLLDRTLKINMHQNNYYTCLKASENSKELHNYDTCRCYRGKRRLPNEKRRNFYKSDDGKSVRKNYHKKNAVKKQLIDDILKITVSKNGKLTRASIIKMVNMIQL